MWSSKCEGHVPDYFISSTGAILGYRICWWYSLSPTILFKKKHKRIMRPLNRMKWSRKRTGRQGPGISVALSLLSTTLLETLGRMASFRCWCVLEPGMKKLFQNNILIKWKNILYISKVKPHKCWVLRFIYYLKYFVTKEESTIPWIPMNVKYRKS